MLIEWEDSAQPVPTWVYLAGYEKPTTVKCASVGWLIYDGKDVKALAPNMGDVEGEQSLQVSGVIRIPTRCVSRIKRLREP